MGKQLEPGWRTKVAQCSAQRWHYSVHFHHYLGVHSLRLTCWDETGNVVSTRKDNLKAPSRFTVVVNKLPMEENNGRGPKLADGWLRRAGQWVSLGFQLGTEDPGQKRIKVLWRTGAPVGDPKGPRQANRCSPEGREGLEPSVRPKLGKSAGDGVAG